MNAGDRVGRFASINTSNDVAFEAGGQDGITGLDKKK